MASVIVNNRTTKVGTLRALIRGDIIIALGSRRVDRDAGKVALGWSVFTCQVTHFASLTLGKISGALGLVGMTLTACSLGTLSDSASLCVALRGSGP